MSNKGLLFIVSAPAGTGKTTLVRKLVKEFPNIEQSISYTTRAKRAQEKEGIDYHFISVEEFQKKKKEGEFLEFAKVFSDYYATSKKQIETKQKKGIHQILVIDTQGAKKLKKMVKAIYIFISPPSITILRKRLQGRKTETEESLTNRLSWAKKELGEAKYYDYLIINDQLEQAFDALRSIVIAEEHRIH